MGCVASVELACSLLQRLPIHRQLPEPALSLPKGADGVPRQQQHLDDDELFHALGRHAHAGVRLAGQRSGSLTFWIDDAQQASLTSINNSSRRIDPSTGSGQALVRWGPVNGVDNGTRGTYFLDYFQSHRYSFIGGLLAGGHVLARPVIATLTASPV